MTIEQASLGNQPGLQTNDVAILVIEFRGSSEMLADAGDLNGMAALMDFHHRTTNLLHEFHGWKVKSLGDGLLTTFDSVKNALDFARKLQRSLSARPIEAGGRQLRASVTIHFGVVRTAHTSYGMDIFGTAVDLAARLTSFAEPGQIVISGAARSALPDNGEPFMEPPRIENIKGEKVEVTRVDVSQALPT